MLELKKALSAIPFYYRYKYRHNCSKVWGILNFLIKVQYHSFYSIFDQINTAFMSIRDIFPKIPQTYTEPVFFDQVTTLANTQHAKHLCISSTPSDVGFCPYIFFVFLIVPIALQINPFPQEFNFSYWSKQTTELIVYYVMHGLVTQVDFK